MCCFRNSADLEQQEANQVTGIGHVFLLKTKNVVCSITTKWRMQCLYYLTVNRRHLLHLQLLLKDKKKKLALRLTSILTMSSALSICPSWVQHRAIPSSTSLLMLRLLSEIHSRQLLYASKAFCTHHAARTEQKLFKTWTMQQKIWCFRASGKKVNFCRILNVSR